MRFCSELVRWTVLAASLSATGFAGESAPPVAPAATPAPSQRVVSVVRTDARTGRLVRSVVVSPKPVQSKPVPERPVAAETIVLPNDPGYRALAAETAKNLDVNPLLVDSVIQVESNYNPYAVSPKGAQGLMQLMPATARRFGVKNSFDPRENIEAGVKYLKFLQETFKDDRLAIAAYNAGEKAVAKYGNVPPYAETMSYVAKVGKKYGQAKQAAEKTAPPVKPAAVEKPKPAEDEPRHVVGYIDQEGRLHLSTR